MTVVRPLGISIIGALTLAFGPQVSTLSRGAAVERVGTLLTARAAHTATPLASGQVLIAGGMASGGGSLASAEVYDPTDNSTHALGSMAARRAGHTATRLRDGRVLIAGGYDGEYRSSAELFDPASQRFLPTGSLSQGRSGHTATLLNDGRVLVVGGLGRGWSFLASAELYDPATGRFEPVGAMAVPRESHTATLLPDGRVLMVGGHRGRREAIEIYVSAELYDPGSERFAAAGDLLTARHKHDAVGLPDGRVLVIGGADRSDRIHYETTEVYDPASGTFASGPSMIGKRYKIQGTSVRLADGGVLVAAGSRVAEILDPRSFTFRVVAGEFPAEYSFATATPLAGGDVLIVGGYDEQNRNTAGVWRFHAR